PGWILNMDNSLTFLLVFCLWASVAYCSCSQIDMGSVTWILSCDIALTLLVCFSLLSLNFVTYPFVSLNFTTGRPKQAPSLAKRKMAEIPESPYQELHGVQGDVYSNLEELRK
uniref:TYRO protein tyrosine kinase-binding protein n=1 Tax=Gadus morhua TaxID=8049 RepID=A0A8C5AB68_GADMO